MSRLDRSDPGRDELVSFGTPVFGSTVVDLAANPVSIGGGFLAVRLKLAGGSQWIARYDVPRRFENGGIRHG